MEYVHLTPTQTLEMLIHLLVQLEAILITITVNVLPALMDASVVLTLTHALFVDPSFFTIMGFVCRGVETDSNSC